MSAKLSSAKLKVDRAANHIDELDELLREKPPFRYVLETDTQTGRRATYAKKDQAAVEQAAIICGDALHGLRSALDHAYSAIVSPHAPNDRRAQKAIQFPFSQTRARLEEAVKSRYADRISPEFAEFIVNLRAHGEVGGNELLFLLHEQNVVDKHQTLIPTGDFTRISGAELRRQVPDFPNIENSSFGQNRRDVEWPLHPAIRARLGLPGIPLSRILEEELDVPVEITFAMPTRNLPLSSDEALHAIERASNPRPLVQTLHQLVAEVRRVLRSMEAFA